MAQNPEQDPFGGADEAPRREHYNTQYIVANMKKDETRNRLIMIFGAIALIGGITLFMMFSSAKPEHPAAPGAEAAATAEGAAKPAEAKPATPAEAKPADAKPAEAKPAEH